MAIIGSHKEEHVEMRWVRKPSEVHSSVGFKQLRKLYSIDKNMLGSGSFGKVYRATDKKDSSFSVAIKVLNKDVLPEDALETVMDEVDTLRKLDHPNIVKYYETYEDEHYLYFVMELCPGGELLNNKDASLKNHKLYTEEKAAEVIYKCLSALQHCHVMGITHKDIKPENIMFGENGEVRLVDFGLAEDTKRKMHSQVGTPYYIAPEVLAGSYTHKCDIWSLACVLYLLIAGKHPFSGHTRDDVFRKIKKGEFVHEPFFSVELRSLLDQMFTMNPDKRPTARECQTHQWFRKQAQASFVGEGNDAISPEVIESLLRFHGRSLLRRECLQILVKMVNPSEFTSLRAEFNKIDLNRSGTIEIEELREAVRKSHASITDE